MYSGCVSTAATNVQRAGKDCQSSIQAASVVRYNLTMRAKDLKGTMSKLERKNSLVIASEMVVSKSQGKELTQSEVVDHRIRLTYQK